MNRTQGLYIGAGALALIVFVGIYAVYLRPQTLVIQYQDPIRTSIAETTELPHTLPAAAIVAPIAKKSVPLDGALLDAKNATVNILCSTNGSPFKPISGSGVIIDPRGIILTTAHIGQYFILRDYPKPGSISCTIRTGSPAAATFEADILFVSSHWVTANQETLEEMEPLGTGESDFALLYMTKSLSGATLPSPFPYAPLAKNDADTGESVAIGAYGAEFLDAKAIQSNLRITTDTGIIEKRYTFHTDSVDLLSITGSNAAQEGSSGGAVLNAKGELLGLITTTSPEAELAKRSLRAITPTHIRQNFKLDIGQDISTYLSSASLPALAASFSERAATLKDILIKATSK